MKRLLVRLANEGQIKNIRIVLRCGERERILHFICQPSITMDNSVIRSAIEQAKLKLFCVSKCGLAKGSARGEASQVSSFGAFLAAEAQSQSLTQSVRQAKEQLLTAPSKKYPAKLDRHPASETLQVTDDWDSFGCRPGVKMVHNSYSGRIYGAEPKCVRVREIHCLLFYLIYGYDGVENGDQQQMKDLLKKEHPNLDDEDLASMPQIYQPKLGRQSYRSFS